MTIPSSVTTIGDYAFAYCTSLTSISFLGIVAPTSVGANWLSGVYKVFGHAFAASNFPAPPPGATFHGLPMGTNIPASLPGAPTGLIAKQGDAQISLNWTAPTITSGSNIDYYIVYQNGVDVNHTSATSINITGLTNGQNYTFAVAAHNSAGIGNKSSSQVISPIAANSNNGGTTTPGNDNTVYYIALILVVASLVAIFLVMGRKRKDEK
jgi:hypothetical protein